MVICVWMVPSIVRVRQCQRVVTSFSITFIHIYEDASNVITAQLTHYEKEPYHHLSVLYRNTRKKLNSRILIYCFKAQLTSQRNYKIRTTPVFHTFQWTGEIYKTICVIKVETRKCHNSVSTKTLEKFCPPKKNIRLDAMCSSLKNKSTLCI